MTKERSSNAREVLNEVVGVVTNVLAAGRIQVIADNLQTYPDEMIFAASPSTYAEIRSYFYHRDHGYRKVRLQISGLDLKRQLAGIVISVQPTHIPEDVKAIVREA